MAEFEIARGFVAIDAHRDRSAVQREADGLVRDINGRLHDSRGRYVAEGKGGGEAYNRGFFAGFDKDFLTKLRTRFTKIAAALLPVVQTVGMGIGYSLVGAAASVIASGAIQLVGALAPAVGALGVLPAALGGAIFTLVTLKLAISGVGDALKAGLSGDMEKFNEALKKLSPNAQATVKELIALQKPFADMRKSIQDRLFEGMAESIGKLAQAYLPILTARMGEAAGMIGQFIRHTAAFFTLPASVQGVSDSFHNLTSALQPLLGALENIGRAFFAIFTEGSTFLPGLAGSLEAVTGRFADMVEQAKQSGKLADFIGNGLEVLKSLGGVLADIGSIIHSVFTAAKASGGDALGVLGEVVGRIADLFKSAQGQQALTAIFTTIGQLGTTLAPILTSVANAIVPLAGILSNLVVAVGPGVTLFIGALAQGLTALAPAAEPVGRALAAILEAVAPLLPALGTVLANILTFLATELQGVAQEFGPLIGVFSELLINVLTPFLPVLQQFAMVILPIAAQAGEAFAQALEPLIPVLTQIAQSIATQLMAFMPQLAQIMQQMLPVVVQLAQQFGQVLLTALQAIGPHIPELTRAGLELVRAMAQLFVTLAPLMPVFMQLAVLVVSLLAKSGVLTAGINVLTFAMGASANAIVYLVGFVNWAIGAFHSFMGVVSTIPGRVIGAFSGAASWLWNAGYSIMFGLINGIYNAFGWLSSALGSIWGRVTGALAGAGSWLWNAGWSLIQGLISGVYAALPGLQGALSYVSSLIPDWKGPPERDRKLLYPAGQVIMGGLITGINSQRGALRGTLEGVTNEISTAGAGAGGAGAGGAAASAGGSGTFGPYHLSFDGRVLTSFVIDAVTGHPTEVAAAIDEGRRQRGFVDSGRARR